MSNELEYAKQRLMASLYMQPRYIPLAAELLRGDGVLREGTAGRVWGAIQGAASGGRLNIPAVQGAFDKIPGAWDWMGDAQARVPDPLGIAEREIEELCSRIAAEAERDLIAQVFRANAEAIADPSIPIDEVVSNVMSRLSSFRGGEGPRWRDGAEVGDSAIGVIDAWEREEFDGVPTGFPSLDRVLNVLPNGEVIVVAARPSMGKTQLIVQVMANAARRYKEEGSDSCVAFFSPETSGERLYIRMACSYEGIDQNMLRKRQRDCASWEEWERVKAARERIRERIREFKELPIFIDEDPSPTVDNMLMRSLSLHNIVKDGRRLKVGLCVFDFLELTGERENGNEELRVSRAIRGCKVIASTLKCPFLVASQVSREAEGQIPQLSHLRYSGMVEQVAYMVLSIYRPSYYKQRKAKQYVPTLDPERRHAVIMILKNKDGPTGRVLLHFIEEHARFKDPKELDPEAIPPPMEYEPQVQGGEDDLTGLSTYFDEILESVNGQGGQDEVPF